MRMKLLPGMLVCLAIVLAWYVPAVIRGGREYLNATLLHHSVARFAEGTSHVRPFYYFLLSFPGDFLPWILFLPGAAVYGLSGEAAPKRKEFLFLFVWFVVIFLFFSISKGKRSLYLLPLFPAASLMVGKLWDDFVFGSMERFRRGWISFPLYGLMGLMLIGGAAVPWVVSMKFPSYLAYGLPIAFLMVGSSLTLFVLNRFKSYGAILFLVAGIMAGVHFYALRVIFPLVNPYKSARFFSQEITSRIRPSEKLAIYENFGTGPFNYYTGIVPILELKTKEEFFRFFESSERVFCILKYRNLRQFQSMEGMPATVLIARRQIGDKDVALISNR
jgi:4-amino-4-deoxy-L-arabinose transferase-like glycosyltransferase